MALTVFGPNTDQAIANGKSGKRAKISASNNPKAECAG
jgi:hypothetical protein